MNKISGLSDLINWVTEENSRFSQDSDGGWEGSALRIAALILWQAAIYQVALMLAQIGANDTGIRSLAALLIVFLMTSLGPVLAEDGFAPVWVAELLSGKIFSRLVGSMPKWVVAALLVTNALLLLTVFPAVSKMLRQLSLRKYANSES